MQEGGSKSSSAGADSGPNSDYSVASLIEEANCDSSVRGQTYLCEDAHKGCCMFAAREFAPAETVLCESWLAYGTNSQVFKALRGSPFLWEKARALYPRSGNIKGCIDLCGFCHPNGPALGNVLLFRMSFLSHSCVPTCSMEIDIERQTSRLVARRPVSQHEELAISYLIGAQLEGSTAKRQKSMQNWKFVCQCEACRQDAPGCFKAQGDIRFKGKTFVLQTVCGDRPAYASQGAANDGFLLYWKGEQWRIGRQLVSYEERRCPKGHALKYFAAKSGSCDGCRRRVVSGEYVLDCRSCNWYLCDACCSQEI
jgi:hypothetical protein